MVGVVAVMVGGAGGVVLVAAAGSGFTGVATIMVAHTIMGTMPAGGAAAIIAGSVRTTEGLVYAYVEPRRGDPSGAFCCRTRVFTSRDGRRPYRNLLTILIVLKGKVFRRNSRESKSH